MWIIEKHFESLQNQDLSVMIKVRELEYCGAPDVKSLIMDFKNKLKLIPQTNAFSASELYKMKELNSESVEVWKTTVYGNDKSLMFTLTKSKEKFNPFNF